jgi:hypothetical protein
MRISCPTHRYAPIYWSDASVKNQKEDGSNASVDSPVREKKMLSGEIILFLDVYSLFFLSLPTEFSLLILGSGAHHQ